MKFINVRGHYVNVEAIEYVTKVGAFAEIQFSSGETKKIAMPEGEAIITALNASEIHIEP
jgi:hypothetical protein